MVLKKKIQCMVHYTPELLLPCVSKLQQTSPGPMQVTLRTHEVAM